jgi:hypothetical protein
VDARANVGTVSLDVNERRLADDGSLTITSSHAEPTDAVARADWLLRPKGNSSSSSAPIVPTQPVLDGNYRLLNVEREWGDTVGGATFAPGRCRSDVRFGTPTCRAASETGTAGIRPEETFPRTTPTSLQGRRCGASERDLRSGIRRIPAVATRPPPFGAVQRG